MLIFGLASPGLDRAISVAADTPPIAPPNGAPPAKPAAALSAATIGSNSTLVPTVSAAYSKGSCIDSVAPSVSPRLPASLGNCFNEVMATSSRPNILLAPIRSSRAEPTATGATSRKSSKVAFSFPLFPALACPISPILAPT